MLLFYIFDLRFLIREQLVEDMEQDESQLVWCQEDSTAKEGAASHDLKHSVLVQLEIQDSKGKHGNIQM